jgi:hypothetical protein
MQRRYAGMRRHCDRMQGRCDRMQRLAHLYRSLALIERWVGTGFSGYWFVTVGEQPRIQPSVSWIAKSSFEPVSYFDRPTKFAPEQIVAIEVTGPMPHRTHLPSVLNFIGQRVSNARVNLCVQN